MTKPRVTVLMSVHNGGRWLRAAVESVLAQTWRDFEFLILDDASTDDSAAQIAAFCDPRIRLLRLEENLGLTRCLNLGLREARGEFIARQDADDLSAPERLEKQVAFLDQHPACALVGAQARVIGPGGRSRGVRALPQETVAIRWLSLLDNPIIHTAAMARAAVIRDELGGYDESFPCCQDYDLWARVFARHGAANLAGRLVVVREHGASISATRKAEAQAMVRRVTRRLADTWLHELALTDDDVALLCAYRRHLHPAEVAPFHALLARVEERFFARFGEAHSSDDLQATRAAAFGRIAYNLLTRDRRLALAELRRALRTWPGVSAQLPWLRIGALFLLGARARRLAGAASAETETPTAG